MNLLAIDPGADTGWAHFKGLDLTHVGVCEPLKCPVGWWVDVLVIERPTIYPRSKTPPEDIVTLALRAGMCIGRFYHHELVEVEPRTWKGQVPKDIHHRRILKEAGPNDSLLLMAVPLKVRHNALDAYALGRWYLKGGRP